MERVELLPSERGKRCLVLGPQPGRGVGGVGVSVVRVRRGVGEVWVGRGGVGYGGV